MNKLNPKIKVYLACPWKNKDEAKAGKLQLEEAGLEVTSRWIDLHFDKEAGDPNNGQSEKSIQILEQEGRLPDCLIAL